MSGVSFTNVVCFSRLTTSHLVCDDFPCSKSTNWGLNGHVININHTNLQNHKEWIKKGRHCCCNGARSDCKWFQYIIIDWE